MEQYETRAFAQRLNLHYGCIQILYWLIYTVMTAYIVILLQERGFSNREIGYANAVRTCVAVISQLSLAFFADRKRSFSLKYLISVLMGVCMLANLIFHVRTLPFYAVFCVFIIFGATEMAIVSLMDSMAMQYINVGIKLNYSACRGAGAAAYAIMSLVLGRLLDLAGAEIIVPLHGMLILLYIMALLTFPVLRKDYGNDGSSDTKSSRPPSSFAGILRGNLRYAVYLAAIVILFTGYMGIFTFMSNIMSHAGGSNSQLGVSLFVYSVSQVPMMLWLFTLLKRHLPAARLVLLSGVMQIIHCFCLYLAASPGQIILVQCLEMFAFGLYIPASVYFMNEIVSPIDRVKGQTLAMTASNLGATLGAGLFGLIIDQRGVQAMLLTGNAFVFSGVVLMAAALCGPFKRAGCIKS